MVAKPLEHLVGIMVNISKSGSVVDVSHETKAKLKAYDALLHKWQRAVNLVSPLTLSDSWSRHIMDSAQISKILPLEAKVLADLGCGGGFPGLVLAMMHPELDVHLIESDEKKCQFMRSVSRETHTPVTIHTARIEQAHGLVRPDIVTARALAALDKLLEFCWPWAQENRDLVCIFLKGERYEEEVAAARKKYNFTINAVPSVTDGNARILVVSDLVRCE